MSVWLAILATGCTAWRIEKAEPKQLLRNGDVSAIRITRSDSAQVEIYDPALIGDSIYGHPTPLAIAKVVVPLSKIQKLETKRTSIVKTFLFVLGVGGAVALYGLLQSLNQGT